MSDRQGRRVRDVEDSEDERGSDQSPRAADRSDALNDSDVRAASLDGSDEDSSEEESEDDEAEIEKIREGFIVDDDEDDVQENSPQEDESNSEERRRVAKRAKRRSHPQPEEELDEDDLDLVREAQGEQGRKFKRLRRAGEDSEGKGLRRMFSDDEDEDEDRVAYPGEFDDFIEQDEYSDDEAQRLQEERETRMRARPQNFRRSSLGGDLFAELQGRLDDLDEDKLNEIHEVFGDGEMYDWALEAEEDLDDRAEGRFDEETGEERPLDLKDVFEPSDLAAHMLTEEDNIIRTLDIPERFQLLRKTLGDSYELDEDDFKAKQAWVSSKLESERNMMFAVRPELRDPFKSAVARVVRFIARDNREVPFIWHHRRDYLVHTEVADKEAEDQSVIVHQLLTQDDLWRILALDLEFHAILRKKKSVLSLWETVGQYATDDERSNFKRYNAAAATVVEYQDVMEWMQYTFSAHLEKESADGGGLKLRSRFRHLDRLRAGPINDLALKLEIHPASLASSIAADERLGQIKEPDESPEEYARVIAPSFETEYALNEGKFLAAARCFYDPEFRWQVRRLFEAEGKVNVVLTDDGRRKIDNNSPFADIKYATNWTFNDLRLRSELFLRMLEAERQGLLVVRIQYPQYKETLLRKLESYSINDVPDSKWNNLRKEAIKELSRLTVPLVCRNIREDLRADCQRALASEIRSNFLQRLNQAPYKPPGYVAGTVPRVLAISSGMGQRDDACLAAVVDEDGNTLEQAKLGDLRDAALRIKFLDLVKKHSPDVVAIAGYSPTCMKTYTMISEIVSDAQLTAGEQDDKPLEVIWARDEVARLYKSSERAERELAGIPTLGRYCVGVARYVQSPLLEYAALGPETKSLSIHRFQHLLPTDVLEQALESALVDVVNLEGVDINIAARNSNIATIVPYIGGLGRRKASHILQLIQGRGGELHGRQELVTKQIMGACIFMNSASFLKFSNDAVSTTDDTFEPLDSTRVHPEDYELARKMAGDALELDEEDIQGNERDHNGGVIGRLFEEGVDKVNDLVLEDYAAELETTFHQRKLLTLRMIRDELLQPYRELRDALKVLKDSEIFTMLTGETTETLKPGVVISVIVRKVFTRQLRLQLSCGIDAVAEAGNISDDRSRPIAAQFAPGQAVQAVVLTVDYGRLFVEVSTRQHVVKDVLVRLHQTSSFRDPSKWNFEAEQRDEKAAQQRIEYEQRHSRFIKHPLFHAFNAKQAEEYLAPLQRGDVVIRPSSRGNDHIAITWKVGDMMYQHIDVIEHDKPNEFSVGRTLQVGQYRFSDLDELIITHIQAMTRKIDEMCQSEKFQSGSKADVDKWLTAYTNARPKQSVYAFCFDHKRPGYFLLCFKTGAQAPVQQWHVKVIPNGYELMGNSYPDVPSLCNGFKLVFQSRRQH